MLTSCGRRGRRRRDQSGASAVEFALMLPILLMFLFGIMDFGYLINRSSLINNAARDAAREASLGLTQDQVRVVADRGLADLADMTDVAVSCRKPNGAVCSSYDDRESGDTAVVTITYVHEMITPVGVFFDNLDMSRTAQMRIE